MGLKSVLFSGILLSAMAVGVQAKPETGSGLDKSLLPQPVYSPEPGFVDLYWAAWDLAWGRVKHQDGIPQSPYMDENLWDDTIWIWDTEFMVLFCRYAPSLFPGIQSLDNFYKTILDGDSVSLKIWHPDNPPFFAWVEYEYYKMTGDKRRLEYVLEDNRYLQRHYRWFEELKRGGSRFSKMPVMLERREKGYLWGDVQSGMDNTPRGRGCDGEMLWMDALAQQALAALYIERIAEVLDDPSTAKEFAGEYAVKKDLLNKYYWDAEDGFYYDIEEATGDFVKVRTPAVYCGLCWQKSRDGNKRRVWWNMRRTRMSSAANTLGHPCRGVIRITMGRLEIIGEVECGCPWPTCQPRHLRLTVIMMWHMRMRAVCWRRCLKPIRLLRPTPFGNVILRRQPVPDSGWTVRT